MSTIVPGLTLAALFIIYYWLRATVDPGSAPRGTAAGMPPARLAIYVVRSLALPLSDKASLTDWR